MLAHYAIDGRLSLKAIGLFPLMWTNADAQGRLLGFNRPRGMILAALGALLAIVVGGGW